MEDDKFFVDVKDDQKRIGWADAFKKMAKNNDDQLLISAVFEDEDNSEWTWSRINL